MAEGRGRVGGPDKRQVRPQHVDSAKGREDGIEDELGQDRGREVHDDPVSCLGARAEVVDTVEDTQAESAQEVVLLSGAQMRSDGAGRGARVLRQVDHGIEESPHAGHGDAPAGAIDKIDPDTSGAEHVVNVLLRILLGAGTLERQLEPVHRLGGGAWAGIGEDHEIIRRCGEHEREVVGELDVARQDVSRLETRIASDGQQALLGDARGP